jgi:uncharacterized protein involved in response to NO
MTGIGWKDEAGRHVNKLFLIWGVFVGIVGVALWPITILGMIKMYAGPLHVRLMIEGFVTAVFVGCSGYIVPSRYLVRGYTWFEVFIFGLLMISLVIFHMSGWREWGDVCFAGVMIHYMFWLHRIKVTGIDEIFWLLLAMGCGIVGVMTEIFWPHFGAWSPDWVLRSGRNFLYHGYSMMVCMRLLWWYLARSSHTSSEDPNLTEGGRGRFRCGLWMPFMLIPTGYLVDGIHPSVSGDVLVMLGWLTFFLQTRSFWYALRPVGSIQLTFVVGILCLVSSVIGVVLWNSREFIFWHLQLMGGVGILTFAVSSWVVYENSGDFSRFTSRVKPLNWMLVIMVIGMVTRVSADMVLHIRLSHLAYASVTWAIASLLWLWVMIPAMRRH